jgi:3-oxoacyl-[acyl-carrier-protein] synthase-3
MQVRDVVGGMRRVLVPGQEFSLVQHATEQATTRMAAVGIALPERRQTTDELLATRRHRFPLPFQQHTGIAERRVCGPGEDSGTLAVGAARDALAHWGGDPAGLGMVVSCSITRYRGEDAYDFEPGYGFAVKEAIGAHDALHFDVNNACAGMLTGVHLVDNFIRRGVVRSGLVVSGERITSLAANAARTIRSYTSKQLASLTLGDAGAAVVLERAPDGAPGLFSEVTTYAEHADLCIGRPDPDAPGARMDTDGSGLHRAAILSAPRTILRSMERNGFTPDDVDHVIPHQTSVPAIRAGIKHTERKVGTYAKNVIYNVEKFGNTSSTTHFVALHECLNDGRVNEGDRVVMLCYASGLTVGVTGFPIDGIAVDHARSA